MLIYRKIHLLVCLFIFIFSESQILETTSDLQIDEKKNSLQTRFKPPVGYTWVNYEEGSFSDFLSDFGLLPAGFPVRDYQSVPVVNQSKHAAILNIDVGEKDLQQCADAWIRLYSEYLWSQKRYNEIRFQFTSGQYLSWNDFSKGTRTIETGATVKFVKKGKKDSSYQNFRNYLNLVFRYAGTISLDRESELITDNKEVRVGDIIIKPGSPGHSVIIIAAAQNRLGKRVYLLAESFMPAQDVHILKNPLNQKISPWFELDVNAPQTNTGKYVFKPTAIKRFHNEVKKSALQKYAEPTPKNTNKL